MSLRSFQIGYIIILLLASMVSSHLTEGSEQPTPLPRSTIPSVETDFRAFPVHMYCPEIVPPFAGARWGDITIGMSTVDELQGYLDTLGGRYFVTFIAERFNFDLVDTTIQSDFIPSTVVACIDPESAIITALNVTIRSDTMLTIRDLVFFYGIPNAVTWDEVPGQRILFWFDQGIAASVRVDFSEVSPQYGGVMGMVYFPFQSVHHYARQWPYNRTALSAPEIFYVTTPLPLERNPFDFDAMIATITVESSRTPTPEFTPCSVTATPASIP